MRVWRRLRNAPLGMICLCFLLAVVALALCAPLAAPWDPTAIDVRNKFAAWSLAHPLGTDQLSSAGTYCPGSSGAGGPPWAFHS